MASHAGGAVVFSHPVVIFVLVAEPGVAVDIVAIVIFISAVAGFTLALIGHHEPIVTGHAGFVYYSCNMAVF
jgi:hypothetical protein